MALDVTRLKTLWRIAFAFGAFVFLAGLFWSWTENFSDWVWWVAAFGLAAIAYNVCFFVLCSWKAPELAAFITGEDTKVEGDNVVIETTHAETGDETLNFFIRAYMHARGATYVAISTVIMISIALAIYFFA